ncbi:MAG TPA: glycoside hydrolase family 2 TIM barrel-domain containing protein, partial [Chloroflexota bacterium]|nr:glycoside hydrolase family 2 TIM barrel-domain containing protein [Chloroflexota bacterium]
MQPPLPAAGAARPGAPSTAPGAGASAPPGPSSANPDGDADIPRPEHPRPDLRRDEWVNLNGVWRFSFDPQNRGEQQRWYRIPHPDVAARTGEVGSPVEDPFLSHIVVPFPWESRLSGVADPTYKGAAWYQRALEVPSEWMDAGPGPAPTPDGGADSAPAPPPGAAPRRPPTAWLRRPTLCFGAVDWSAKVWVDGRFVTEHEGGYTPFYVDLTPYLRPGRPATLTVRVWDACDADTLLGKQVDEWYTHSGGIWQPVWLEGRPAAYIAQAHVTPHLETGRASFAVAVDATGESAAGAYRVAVTSEDGAFPPVETGVEVTPGRTTVNLEVRVPQPRAWSPESPHLYDCVVTLTPQPPPPGDTLTPQPPPPEGEGESLALASGGQGAGHGPRAPHETPVPRPGGAARAAPPLHPPGANPPGPASPGAASPAPPEAGAAGPLRPGAGAASPPPAGAMRAAPGGVGAQPPPEEEDSSGDAVHAAPPPLAARAAPPAARVGDAVHTYFGLRAVGSGRWGGKPYEYVLLNGAPVYLRGALDQAFHPDGLHAYPSDAAIRADVQAAKALGLNLLRCHIKVNDPRYYYWCDRLGVLMMYDLPSCDLYTPTARANWEATFRAALARDYSHPCIIAWVLFNETWGLEEHQTPASWQWVREMYRVAKELDPSRLVEDNSPNKYDHVLSDLNSWHFYIDNYRRARQHVSRVVAQTREGGGFNYVSRLYGHVDGASAYTQATAPLLNSEYAGLTARGGDLDISYSFKFLTTELRRHDMVCGYVYTELTDVEWEHNGFLNYDRSPKAFGYDHFVPGMTVADLNGADFVGLDCPPCHTAPPGAERAAPVFFSHWDPRPIERATLRWRVSAIDRLGQSALLDEGQCPIEPQQYGVIDCGEVRFTLPSYPGLVTVALQVVDGGGAVRARNYVNVDVTDEVDGGAPLASLVSTTRTPEGGYAIAFAPEA